MLIAGAFALSRGSQADITVEFLIENGLTVSGADGLEVHIRESMDLITRGTKFESRYVINEIPKPDEIAVIVFLGPKTQEVPNAPGLVKTLANNCAAVGKRYIFSDAWFLQRFLDKRKIARSPDGLFPDPRASHIRSLVTWVLAHELGHLIFGHSSDGNPHSFEASESVMEFSHRREFEADKFVAAVLEQDDTLEYEMMCLFGDIVRQEIAYSVVGAYPSLPFESYPSPTFGYSGIVEYANSKSHPHFILRLTRLVEMVGNFDKPGNDQILIEIQPLIENLRDIGK